MRVCACVCACVAFVFYFPLGRHWFVGFCFVWLLTMSWLNASKSYTNWTIKDILNSDTDFFFFFAFWILQTHDDLSLWCSDEALCSAQGGNKDSTRGTMRVASHYLCFFHRLHVQKKVNPLFSLISQKCSLSTKTSLYLMKSKDLESCRGLNNLLLGPQTIMSEIMFSFL